MFEGVKVDDADPRRHFDFLPDAGAGRKDKAGRRAVRDTVWPHRKALAAGAAGQTIPGPGAGGRPTVQGLAASRPAMRAVALCSGLWSGGRDIEQIDADNAGLGGTGPMEESFDDLRKRVSIRCYAAAASMQEPVIKPKNPVPMCPRQSMNPAGSSSN